MKRIEVSTGLVPDFSEEFPESAFLNRELSWLAFNERVLAAARDVRIPLLERLKFTAIAGSNLDEFFMVRVAGILQQLRAGVTTASPDGLTPQQTIGRVRAQTRGMLANIEVALTDILRELTDAGVPFVQVKDLGDGDRVRLQELYEREIHPVLTPLAVDPSHPFPYLSNLSLNLAVLLAGDAGEPPDFARVKVPVGVLPRVVELDGRYLLLEDVIAAHLPQLFTGREILACHLFRITRDTDYEFEEEEAEDLLRTIEEGLQRRRFGNPVRLDVHPGMPADLRHYLARQLDLEPQDVFELAGPLGVADFIAFHVARPELMYPPFAPRNPDIQGFASVFATLRAGDVLLHHPYDGFEDVLMFLEAAADDPAVLAIKMTLYRTGNDERLFAVLRRAAELGKQVVALIELKARFDEERNIHWARSLEHAGAHVVYGVAGLKTHAKVTLVVRREDTGLRAYAHVGTGNYNPRTARLYTDVSLLTAEPDLGADVGTVFNVLTGYAHASYRALLVAPEHARDQLKQRVGVEIERARRGEDAWLLFKMNQLTDPDIITALYDASRAGVRVRLLVRGVCALRPGVPGVSDGIEVRSLLGRFLEHARVFAFASGAVYFGSADLMTRNLSRRVEVLAPLLDPAHRRRALEILETEWQDERGSWELRPDGTYVKREGNFSAQEEFMQTATRD